MKYVETSKKGRKMVRLMGSEYTIPEIARYHEDKVELAKSELVWDYYDTIHYGTLERFYLPEVGDETAYGTVAEVLFEDGNSHCPAQALVYFE